MAAEAPTLRALLEQAWDESLLLRTEDGHELILAPIDDFDREIELTRQSAELMRLLVRRTGERATVSLEEVRAQLGIG